MAFPVDVEPAAIIDTAPADERPSRTETGSFARALKARLTQRDFRLLSAELAMKGRKRVWVVTVETPSKRVVVVQAEPATRDPFDLRQADRFARVLADKFK